MVVLGVGAWEVSSTSVRDAGGKKMSLLPAENRNKILRLLSASPSNYNGRNVLAQFYAAK